MELSGVVGCRLLAAGSVHALEIVLLVAEVRNALIVFESLRYGSGSIMWFALAIHVTRIVASHPGVASWVLVRTTMIT